MFDMAGVSSVAVGASLRGCWSRLLTDPSPTGARQRRPQCIATDVELDPQLSRSVASVVAGVKPTRSASRWFAAESSQFG